VTKITTRYVFLLNGPFIVLCLLFTIPITFTFHIGTLSNLKPSFSSQISNKTAFASPRPRFTSPKQASQSLTSSLHRGNQSQCSQMSLDTLQRDSMRKRFAASAYLHHGHANRRASMIGLALLAIGILELALRSEPAQETPTDRQRARPTERWQRCGDLGWNWGAIWCVVSEHK
jgi:hypothetical protein